ncbi:peptide maturation system acyl carrier-related protein [Ruminiclostridium sufflavum DSM 19573]|uniref:Peptide maturation system acyl carrier-related protein n=1 Tax=Ruminiclostridium sufflavum DSM 19573 TaxID=1121337 RepID=A0A318Y2E3_9FIRM|nr:peptide maturation system acyl carrier-related protein [Ruminiclostridium sufflavum]PYG89727.1 peptide maturation system acyl carrier-related protein [Ruminiclostridium sufflavum DSM 19573]
MEDLLSIRIKEDLIKIFNNRFDIDFNELGEDYYSKNLLGKELKLYARDLLYIYFDAMNDFNISIPQEDIVQGKFSTFDGIFEIILRQMKQKEMSAC